MVTVLVVVYPESKRPTYASRDTEKSENPIYKFTEEQYNATSFSIFTTKRKTIKKNTQARNASMNEL